MFIGLVVVHEFGHFIVARRNGIEVEEFGIFFPPRLWKKRIKSPKGDYDFTINALPLGGFVRLKGEHDSDKTPGSFGAAPLWAKVKVMTAGVALNLVTAFLLLTLAALIGIPKLVDNQFTVASDTKVMRQEVLIGYVEPGSPADKAGLEVRDHVKAIGLINGQKQIVKTADDFMRATRTLNGEEVEIHYLRGGEAQKTQATLRSKAEVDKFNQENHCDDNNYKGERKCQGFVGVGPSEYTLQRSTWSAPIVAGGLIKQFTELTLKGLGSAIANLFRGNTQAATENVAGPVGIFVILKDSSLLGFQFILMIIAVISLTLAIMNVLPIPALDGGRLFVTLLFRGIRKPLTQRTEELIHGTGFLMLMTLFVLITIVDVKRFF